MGKKSLNLTDELYDYMLEKSLREPDILRNLREETGRMLMSAMQSPPEESQFIALLLKLTGAKRILELGTFTGYTTLWMAMVIPSDGKIITCDVDNKWTSIGSRYWEEAGVSHKIDLRIAPALNTIDKLLESGYENIFDFIFIDADKDNYVNYYERALKLVRPGGIIGVDNVFWSGSVIDSKNQGSDVRNIRQLNKSIYEDQRVTISMVPIGDGLTLAIRDF
ncbi:putative O-methyltransferase YrrM [Ruminiclostridium sufflavum DSM 19573]|uniref:Putative O-methyltransferase YrrM n=1 Tax=Ruminiclostridium sufflavum DSM 19573 TaxID=1121337 RepID=A0A318XUN8_9FIRM|nr:class I SAM-dependent methyltransferase [Ruminiclostridium sufflavum]PYG86587.1 putative O-methyltransferase YrrM [Ruminiclostridium sufflavum DSM 19573]